jgi:hypothetical protein
MVVTILGALVLDLSLKYAFHRPRPVPFFVPAPYTYSFPSGHSLFSFCFYGVLAGLLTRRIRSRRWRVLIWTLAALLVATIGLSRVYLGVHYPSDVIAGYLAFTLGEHAGSARSCADTAEGRTQPWRLADSWRYSLADTSAETSPLVRRPMVVCGGLV